MSNTSKIIAHRIAALSTRSDISTELGEIHRSVAQAQLASL
jgi:hypothetical protein